MFSLMVRNPLELRLFYKPLKKRLHTLRLCDVFFDGKQFLRIMPVLYTLKEKFAHFHSKSDPQGMIVKFNSKEQNVLYASSTYSQGIVSVYYVSSVLEAQKNLANSISNDTISVSLLLVRYS